MIGQSESPAGRDPVQDAAFSKFYKEAVPPLIAFLRHLGAPYDVAADCVQETMVKALPPVWATLNKPRAWCRTTSRNFYLRHVTRRREQPDQDIELAANPLISPDTDVDELEAGYEINWLLQQLPDRQREVMAYVFDDASYQEISQALDIDVTTVRSTCRTARQKLIRLQAKNRSGGDDA